MKSLTSKRVLAVLAALLIVLASIAALSTKSFAAENGPDLTVSPAAEGTTDTIFTFTGTREVKLLDGQDRIYDLQVSESTDFSNAVTMANLNLVLQRSDSVDLSFDAPGTYYARLYYHGWLDWLGWFTKESNVVTITIDAEYNVFTAVTPEEGGVITLDKATAFEGEEVFFNVEANEGYDLVGYDITDAEGESIAPSTVDEKTIAFVMPASDVTITAEFKVEELYSYTLTFDANGGKLNEEMMNPMTEVGTKEESFDFVTPGKEVNPTKENSNFLGWAETKDAKEAKYGADEKVTLTKDDPELTLYAVWEDVPGKGTTPGTGFDGSDAVVLGVISMLLAAVVLGGAFIIKKRVK